jgi:hypothetical protein
MDEITWEEVIRLARRAAHKARGNHGPFELEDVQQEALAELARVWDRLPVKTPGYIFRVLEKAAGRWASRERYEAQLSTAQYVYTAQEVRALLHEAYFLPGSWDVPTQEDTPDATWIEPGTLGVSLMDLQAAIGKLNDRYQGLIIAAFLEDVKLSEPDRRALNRAIHQITRHLNMILFQNDRDYDSGPGSRETMPNSRAIWLTGQEQGQTGPRRERDSLSRLQAEREQERSDPPGTHFDWGAGK